MFPDYQAQVLLAYQKLRAANTLSPRLMRPSPAKLRQECLAVCQERYLKKDEKLLRFFFEPQPDRAGYMLAIKQVDIDKFRPLRIFLEGGTANPSERIVELLAWLIDFEPRPYQFGLVYPNPAAPVVEAPVVEEPAASPTIPIQIPVVRTTAAVKNRKLRYALTAIILAALLGGGIYLINENRAAGCMAWSANHYKAVPCTLKNDSLSTIAVDTFRLAHFKRIDKPDTITGRALGSIWYIKLNGRIEYYTAGGAHPVYPERRLKPLTLYMLNKYIRHL